MLALGQALLCRPRLLLVDELSLGLAPLLAGNLLGILERRRAELGLTILLVEQNVAAALKIADYGYVMEHGRIVYEDPAPLLSIQDLRLAFGGLQVLAGVSVSVGRGEILALVGPNGAGKTSLLNCVNGLYRPDAGRILYAGEEITGWPPPRGARRGGARPPPPA